jgi:hypothetical protein
MIIQLSDDLESVVRAAVLNGEFHSEDDMVATVLREYLHRRQEQASNPAAAVPPAETPAPPAGRKPLWERAAELRNSIPADEWEKLPADGATIDNGFVDLVESQGIPVNSSRRKR